MQQRSALARLQQVITISLVSGAIAWAWWWRESPGFAVLGAMLIVLGYSLFLAAEFFALRFVGQGGEVPRPSWTELAGAWLAETLTAPRVFCWRQPFLWNALPDEVHPQAGTARRGVVFIHGFVCNRGFWTPWLKRMHAEGRRFAAVNLEPVVGSIDSYAPIVEKAVSEVTQATGMPPILVCHSMGGLAARSWLRAAGNAGRVQHVITIGTPHRGTWLARFSRLANGAQMRIAGSWLEALERSESGAGKVPFTCWYSNCDNIVFPAPTATLPGADNRLVRGAAHVDLAFRAEVMDPSFALIARSDPV